MDHGKVESEVKENPITYIRVETSTVRFTVTDALVLAAGLGVLPLAWVAWTNPFFRTYPAYLVTGTSIFWVPAGLIVVAMWLQENLPFDLPGFHRLRRGIQNSPRAAAMLFPLVTSILFLTLFAMIAGNAVLAGSGLSVARENTFVTGLVTTMVGLLIAYSWLGAKEDYSRTSYVMTYSNPGQGNLGSRLLPRAHPGPKPSERQREAQKSAGILADMLGLSVVVAGILLMIVSTFLG